MKVQRFQRYHKSMDGIRADDGAWCLYDDVQQLLNKADRAILELAAVKTWLGIEMSDDAIPAICLHIDKARMSAAKFNEMPQQEGRSEDFKAPSAHRQ